MSRIPGNKIRKRKKKSTKMERKEWTNKKDGEKKKEKINVFVVDVPHFAFFVCFD